MNDMSNNNITGIILTTIVCIFMFMCICQFSSCVKQSNKSKQEIISHMADKGYTSQQITQVLTESRHMKLDTNDKQNPVVIIN